MSWRRVRTFSVKAMIVKIPEFKLHIVNHSRYRLAILDSKIAYWNWRSSKMAGSHGGYLAFLPMSQEEYMQNMEMEVKLSSETANKDQGSKGKASNREETCAKT